MNQIHVTLTKTNVMKKQQGPLFNSLGVDERENLARQGEEILAAGFNLPRQKNFHHAAFWDIQHQRRSTITRNSLS